MHSAYVGLQSQNPTVRANALEFLDNILQAAGPQPDRAAARQSGLGARSGSRSRTVCSARRSRPREQAVAALVASDDPWLRSCGAYAIGMLRLTTLAPELDRLAATTDDPLLRETVRAAQEKLTSTPKPAAPAGELTSVPETWEAEQQSMGIG